MRNFEWSESHAVRVPAMDDEHREIFRLCADLQRSIMDGASTTDVLPVVADVVIHTAQHFSHEEREMRAAAYPLYPWHRKQHQTARSRVLSLEKRVRRGDRDAVIELVDFLAAWLHDHVRLADRMLGAYLRNHERELSARG